MKKIYDDYNSSEGIDKKFTVGGFINTFCRYWTDSKPSCLKTMNDDLNKIQHDGENCESIGDIESSNGLTYVKGYFGGDWEIPILFSYIGMEASLEDIFLQRETLSIERKNSVRKQKG